MCHKGILSKDLHPKDPGLWSADNNDIRELWERTLPDKNRH